MQVTWLTSPASPSPDLPLRWKYMAQSDSAAGWGHDTWQNSSLKNSSAAIIEIRTEADIERGLTILEDLKGALPVWIFDPESTVRTSVSWMKSGAAHVAATTGEIDEYMGSLSGYRAESTRSDSSLTGRSPAVRSVIADIRLVANRMCNLLIEGETGTGKEVAAREAHITSDRSRGPWVAVNCSAIPETLLEAELFGHVRGAFTGAVQARTGKFEAANHGTIFLDEIGDMPFAVQAKLLRVLQEREVERLGGNERVKLDVRVIAATNVNLAQRVQDGAFREDLYYRLNVFRVVMPALRTRTEDIPLLARHFVEKICSAERLPRKVIDVSAVDRLQGHSWPGNVRELENVIESAVIISGTRPSILAGDLRISAAAASPHVSPAPGRIELPQQGLDYQKALEEFEKNLLMQALSRAQGNKTAAADLLGLKRTTLSAKMRVLESRLPRLVA